MKFGHCVPRLTITSFPLKNHVHLPKKMLEFFLIIPTDPLSFFSPDTFVLKTYIEALIIANIQGIIRQVLIGLTHVLYRSQNAFKRDQDILEQLLRALKSPKKK